MEAQKTEKGAVQKSVKTGRKVSREVEGVGPPPVSMNDIIESAGERTYRLKKQLAKRRPKRESMSDERRHFLFINPGTEKIGLLVYAMKTKGPMPKWCQQGSFAQKFALKNGSLMFEGMLVLNDAQKRFVVKKAYFHPKEPSTIEPIYLRLRDKYANLSKANVRGILKSLETYQLNAARKRPPKVLGKMNLTKPGIIAADIFFPSKLMWSTAPCLCIMDCWSRFSKVYVLERKTKALTLRAFKRFFKELMAKGHRPRILLTDRGSEFVGLPNSPLFQKWGITTSHSPTGTPVHIVEALQAQYMRRASIFRTSAITDNIAHIMHLISKQINKQPRRQFDNKTPLELLAMSKSERKEINAFKDVHINEGDVVQLPGLPPIFVNSTVRFLTWTRKEQAANSKKGYSEKWSRSLHKVTKLIRIKQNRDVFKYYLKDMPNYFWRHELLKVNGKVDTDVPPREFKLKEKMLSEKWDGQPKAPKAKAPKAVPKPKTPKAVPRPKAVPPPLRPKAPKAVPRPATPPPPVSKAIPKSELDTSNIITGRRRRKKRVNYAQFFE